MLLPKTSGPTLDLGVHINDVNLLSVYIYQNYCKPLWRFSFLIPRNLVNGSVLGFPGPLRGQTRGTTRHPKAQRHRYKGTVESGPGLTAHTESGLPAGGTKPRAEKK